MIELLEKENFNSLAATSFEETVQIPAPLDAKALIIPSLNKKPDENKLNKEKLWDLILATNKLLASSKNSEQDIMSIKTTIEKISDDLSSMKSFKNDKFEKYSKILEEVKQSILL